MNKAKTLLWVAKHACLNAWEDRGRMKSWFKWHPLWDVAVVLAALIGGKIWLEGDSFYRLASLAGAAGAGIVAYRWIRDADFLSKRSKAWAMGMGAATPVAMVLIGVLICSAATLTMALVPGSGPSKSSAQAWFDKCHEKVGALGALNQSFPERETVRLSCHQEAGRVGVIAKVFEGALTQQVLRKAEGELGASSLKWSKLEPELSLRAFWEKAGLAPATQKSRGLGGGEPWVGEAMSWSAREAERFAELVFWGWVIVIFAALPTAGACVVGQQIVTASLSGIRECQLAAREWLSRPEFRARMEMRILSSETKGRNNASERSDKKGGRL